MKILISTDGAHSNEKEELQTYLDENYWRNEQLTVDETLGIISIINYIISKRINNSASSLSYTELLTLKNKLR